jgi:hypothetical protein
VSLFSDEREIVESRSVTPGQWPADAFDKVAATLYQALGEWTGHPAPVVSHRLHGRNLDGRSYLDAVGFFAHDIPLELPLGDGPDTNALAARLHGLWSEQVAIPYPTLALAGQAMPAPQLTQVRLNYQPSGRRPEGAIRIIHLDTSVWQPPGEARPYPLDLVVRASGHELRIIARFSESLIGEVSARRLLCLWHAKLEKVFGLR